MSYRAVLFDFDFTLADASQAILAGFRHALEQMGLPQAEEDAVRRTIGLPLEDAFTLLTGRDAPEERRQFRALFSQVAVPMQIESTRIFPGAEELLRSLKAAGIPAAIVSTKRAETLRAVLERRDLLRCFASVTGSEMVSKPKPDPEGLLGAVAALGLTPGQCLYCGDTTIDAQTAQRAGCDFCAVLNGTTPAGAFAPYPAVHIAPDLTDLRTWLGL